MPRLWRQITKKKYWYALEILPPAYQAGPGFLFGEAYDHRKCTVTGKTLPRYHAFKEIGGRYFISRRPLTLPEFKKAMGK
jgi:hypothetical protein